MVGKNRSQLKYLLFIGAGQKEKDYRGKK